MLTIPCMTCKESGTIGGNTCPDCDGDKVREIAEGDFGLSGAHHIAMLRMVADILDKCNDIFEKVNE